MRGSSRWAGLAALGMPARLPLLLSRPSPDLTAHRAVPPPVLRLAARPQMWQKGKLDFEGNWFPQRHIAYGGRGLWQGAVLSRVRWRARQCMRVTTSTLPPAITPRPAGTMFGAPLFHNDGLVLSREVKG